jgi:hypothetical protein
MAQLIFLNECSHVRGNVHPAVARQVLDGLINVLLRIKGILPQVSLISSESLPTLRVGEAYSVGIWLNEGGVARERARFLLGLGQQAPFSAVRERHGDPDPGVSVYKNEGQVVEGIGLAELYGGIPISFDNDVRWRVPLIHLDVEQLVEDEERTWSTDIRHASLVEHVDGHRNWLMSLRRRNISNAKDLCANRAELLPYLEFGPRVESDLYLLQSQAFLQVVEYLYRLDAALEAWNPRLHPFPEYPPNTTDESGGRKHLCQFPAPGGGHAAFTWHGRYTPGAGRIHFRLEHDPKRVILGYVGKKLGA